MATSTETSARYRLDEHPAVVAAQARLGPLRDERRRLEAERARAWELTGADWRSDRPDPRLDAPEEERIGARQRLVELDRELAGLRVREIPAERALRAATDTARADGLRAVNEERRRVVARLASALARCEQVNREALALDERARAIGGVFVTPTGWHELREDTPTEATRLSAWKYAMASEGLL